MDPDKVRDMEEEIRDLATGELVKDEQRSELVFMNNIYEYKFIKKILKEKFRINEDLLFVVNNSAELNGKVINQIHEYKQKVNLCNATVREVGDMVLRELYFFDEKIPKGAKIYKTLGNDFYMQRFLSNNREYLLLSRDKLDLAEYTIKGLQIEVVDYKNVGITAKMSTNLPIIIVNNYNPRIIKYKNHDEFFEVIKGLNLNEEKLMSYIFSSKEKEWLGKSLRHPRLFEWFISSFLFSGNFDGYPNHLMILARQGSGKTRLEECIFRKMNELQPILEASGSTIKSLVPSFKSTNPDVGALITSNRMCIIDEFLRILTRIEKDEREHQLAMLNPLLEHTKRLFKSGNNQIFGNMTSKLLTVSNAIYGTKTMLDLAERIDNAFLSRLLIYYQDEEHINFVQEKKGLVDNICNIEEDTWLAIYDYLNDFNSEINKGELEKIFLSYLNILPEKIKFIYAARYKHHLYCLADGIIKTRCIIELDKSFKQTEKDTDLIKEVWRKIIDNWSLSENINSVPIEDRKKYLTEIEKYIFDTFENQRKKIHEIQMYDLLKDIDNKEIEKGVEYLIKLGLIYKHNHYYYLYYMAKEYGFGD